MSEEEIIEQLLKLPKETREHLVSTYNDAATLFGEMSRKGKARQIVEEIGKQQAIYVRIANALLDSIKRETAGPSADS